MTDIYPLCKALRDVWDNVEILDKDADKIEKCYQALLETFYHFFQKRGSNNSVKLDVIK